MTKRASVILVLSSCLLTQTGWGQESQPASQPAASASPGPASQPAKEEIALKAAETALDLASQVDWSATFQNVGNIANGALSGVSGIGGLLLKAPYHLRLGVEGALTAQNYLSYDKRLVRFVAFPNAGPQLALGVEFENFMVDFVAGGSLGVDLMTYQDLHLALGHTLMLGTEVGWKMKPGYVNPNWIFGLQAVYVRHGTEIKGVNLVSLGSDGLIVSATGRIRPSRLPSLGLRAGIGAERVQTHLPDGKFFETYGMIAQVGISVSFEWTNVQPTQAVEIPVAADRRMPEMPAMPDMDESQSLTERMTVKVKPKEPVEEKAKEAPSPAPSSQPATQPATQPASQPAAKPAKIEATMTPAFRNEMLAAVNAERSRKKLPPLRYSETLEKAAFIHSSDMATHADEYYRRADKKLKDKKSGELIGHQGTDGSWPSDRVARVGYSWFTVAENVALGQESVYEAVQGWMNSPGHRANILNKEMTEIGVAKVGNSWTQVFARPQ